MGSIKKVLSIIGFAGGVLMFTAGVSPQDATTNLSAWLKLIGIDNPPQFLISHTTDTIAFWIGLVLVIMAAMAWLGTTILWPKNKKDNFESKIQIIPLELIFPDECNEEGKNSRFIRSYSVLPKGEKIKQMVSFHDFYIGVKNNSPTKTARNVSVRLNHISMPPLVIDEYLKADNGKRTMICINPELMEYFFLGSGWDRTDRGLFMPKIITPQECNSILLDLNNKPSNFSIETEKSRIHVYDGCKIKLNVYGADIPCSEYTLQMNTNDKLELHVIANEE